MAELIIHQDKIPDNQELIKLCPFGAMEEKDGKVTISAACKMCRLCVRKGPKGAVEYVEDAVKPSVDKSAWKGIAVYVDHVDGKVHPVTLELLGKARELSKVTGHPVYALFMGNGIEAAAHELLVGATTVGRQLAPRVAARMKTGLTADCTILEMDENTDLSQIRPAFGGNIMAHIKTPNHRPQMATVRYKIMNAPERAEKESGEIVVCTIEKEKLLSHVRVLDIVEKPKETFIENADVLVVAGRGVKKPEDLKMLEKLADLLGGQLACTRPMVEAGWLDAKCQIGLSGRTVRPKLIITCGVSGAVQFTAGMNHAETIVAINKDPKAPIFKTAHYCLTGDLYEILPRLIEKIEMGR